MSDFDHAKKRRSKHLQPNPAIQANAQAKRERRMKRNLRNVATPGTRYRDRMKAPVVLTAEDEMAIHDLLKEAHES